MLPRPAFPLPSFIFMLAQLLIHPYRSGTRASKSPIFQDRQARWTPATSVTSHIVCPQHKSEFYSDWTEVLRKWRPAIRSPNVFTGQADHVTESSKANRSRKGGVRTLENRAGRRWAQHHQKSPLCQGSWWYPPPERQPPHTEWTLQLDLWDEWIPIQESTLFFVGPGLHRQNTF